MGYSRGRAALLTGGGAILIALFMLGGASAGSAAAALTLKAPYHGLVLPNNGISASGCNSKATLAKHWNFHMKTGLGGGAGAAKAGNCGAKAIKGFSTYSSADVTGGFEAAVKLPLIPATASNVSANLGGKWTWSISATDGSTNPACKGGLYTYSYNYTTWEWNWTGSYFSSYAYMDSTNSNGVWYNYSYNTASVPSPFNLNSTSYYYSDAGSSTYGSCYSEASIYTDMYAELFDMHTATYTYYSGTNVPSFYDAFVEVYNQTDYGWYMYTEWDGPYNYSYSTPYTTFSYNTTLTSTVFLDYSCPPSYCFSYTTGSNSTQSLSNSTVLTGLSFWFTGSFSATDHYVLVLFVSTSVYTTNSNWQHGSASGSLNAATLGNGIKLASVTMV